MYQVIDSDRTLQFDGELLAHSSSRRDGSERWGEFNLYRTEAGSYVYSRTGFSRLFHVKGCQVVRKGRHKPSRVATMTEDMIPCSVCLPDGFPPDADPSDMIYPERPLHHAQVCHSAGAVVEALAMYDPDGTRYFTHVARELIRTAAEHDQDIKDAYYLETIA